MCECSGAQITFDDSLCQVHNYLLAPAIRGLWLNREIDMKLLWLVSVCLLLGACATLKPNQTQLTFLTEPPGAMLYEGQTAWGLSPQVKIFTSNNGGTTTGAVTAIWSSGARKTMTFNVTLGARQNATNDAALAGVIRAAFPPPSAPTPVVNCTSTNIGGRIQTTCF